MTIKEKPKVKHPQKLKQKILAKKLSDNILHNKGKTEGELMRESGYSESYSKKPAMLKRTLAWQEIMEKAIPEKLVAMRHKQLLNKKETFVGEDEKGVKKIMRSKEIHVQSVAKGVELAYRLRGRLQDSLGIDLDSTKIDEALARLRKIIPASS